MMVRNDSGATVRTPAKVCIGLALGLLVAGCFQPLYGDRSASGAPAVRELLSGVAVDEINTPANTPTARMAVQIQNELRFNFTGGGSAGRPSHRLKMQIAGSRATVSTTNVTGLPINENFVLNASYSVVEIATGRTVLTGRATSTVSYDPAGTQRFARISGMMDAERRAAKVISENVTTRVAAYFVSGS